MCLKRTRLLFLYSTSAGVLLEILLFLAFFYFKYEDIDMSLRVLSSFAVSIPLSFIFSLIAFFVLETKILNEENVENVSNIQYTIGEEIL